MPQSHSAIYVHLVWSTKNRKPYFSDPGIRTDFHAYIGGVSNRLGCPVAIVGGTEDHVHILGRMERTITGADWVKEIKRVSSINIKGKHATLRNFAWQAGYGAFSVSHSNLGRVEEYIANQEEHHRKQTFQEEFRGLLRKHGIEWDERYVWD